MSKPLIVRNNHIGDPVTPGDLSGVVRMCIKGANSAAGRVWLPLTSGWQMFLQVSSLSPLLVVGNSLAIFQTANLF